MATARKLNIVFALSSIGMLVVFTLMIWDDYDRDWKKYQKAFNRLEVKVTGSRRSKAKAQVPTAQQQAMQEEMARAKQDEAQKRDADQEGAGRAGQARRRVVRHRPGLPLHQGGDRRRALRLRGGAPARTAPARTRRRSGSTTLEARWAKLRAGPRGRQRAHRGQGQGDRATWRRCGWPRRRSSKEVFARVQPAGGPPGQDPARLREHRPQPARPRSGQPFAEGQPDHAREPPGRRHLLGHAQGGPLHDLPPRHRQEGVREPAPALHHPPQPRLVPPGAASDRQGRLHLVPPGTRPRHRLRQRRARPVHGGPGEGVGEEVPGLRHLPPVPLLGLPDDGQGPHGGPVHQVPSGRGRGAEGDLAQHRPPPLREVRLQRLPQGQGMGGPAQGRARPHQDRVEDQRGVDLPLDQGAEGLPPDAHAAGLGRAHARPGRREDEGPEQRRGQRRRRLPRREVRARDRTAIRRPATWPRAARRSRRSAAWPATAWATTAAAWTRSCPTARCARAWTWPPSARTARTSTAPAARSTRAGSTPGSRTPRATGTRRGCRTCASPTRRRPTSPPT